MKKWLTASAALRLAGLLLVVLTAQALIGLEVSEECREEVTDALRQYVSLSNSHISQ